MSRESPLGGPMARDNHLGSAGRCARAKGVSERDLRVAELFRREAEFVWRVVRRLGVPDSEAEDVVQEIFLVVAQRLISYEERGTMRAWLVAITRQVVQHAHRSRFRHERKLQAIPSHPPAPPEDPHQRLESNQAVRLVQQFLSEIEPNQALIFYLSEVEDMSSVEIAASLDVNVNTVYSRLRQARKSFEARIRREALPKRGAFQSP